MSLTVVFLFHLEKNYTPRRIEFFSVELEIILLELFTVLTFVLGVFDMEMLFVLFLHFKMLYLKSVP